MALTKLVQYMGFECNEYVRIEEVRITPYDSEEGKKYEVSILCIHYTNASKQHNFNRTKLSFNNLVNPPASLADCYGFLKTNEVFSSHSDC